MPVFITQGRYTQDAVKGMLAKPEDRADSVAQLFAKAGGKMIAYYMTFGEYDFLIVSEGSSIDRGRGGRQKNHDDRRLGAAPQPRHSGLDRRTSFAMRLLSTGPNHDGNRTTRSESITHRC